MLVGSPEFAKYYNLLDAYFSAFPRVNTSGQHFFVQWAAAAEAWRNHAAPTELYFDAMETAVDVAADGTVIVPAILARAPYFDLDGLVAANVGIIGHLIARTLAERYLLPNATIPAECQAPPGTRSDDSIENLLAYECSVNALAALSGNLDQQLPRLAELSPERMLFVSACLKDCIYHRSASSTCSASPVRLKSFREAFWCSHLQTPCLLT